MIEIGDGVHSASSYSIRRIPGEWAFADTEKAEIERHWVRRKSESPSFYNGRVFVMNRATLEQGHLTGTIVETDFAASLYWRETGFRDQLAADCFGDAILVGSDGSLVYGRQASGLVNSGFAYPPSGFLDPKDVDEDGAADLDRSIYRELLEETGYRPSEGERKPGYIIARDGPFLSVGIVFQLSCSGEEFCEKIAPYLASSAHQELEAMVVLKDVADIGRHNISPYAKRIAMALLAGKF